MVTAASLALSRRQKSQEQSLEVIQRIGVRCQLHDILASSKHTQAHVQQLLAAYAVNTLYRYLACCLTFIDLMHAQHLSFALVPVALMVDFLHASSASKQQDRAVHRSSVNTAIKSLRWLAKHGQWHALSACMHNALVASYAKQIDAYDKKEAVPLPLALIVAWELVLCMRATPLTTKLVLGAALLCAHASIRFGDARRVKWGSIQLSVQGLHAVAYATKTTKRGQPFACTWHGISGRDPDSSWLLHWLSALAQLPRKLFETEGCTHEPDFLFPHLDMQSLAVSFLAPASYARALLCLRWAAQDPGLSQQAKLSSAEASALTLHSMKSTALALAAQLHLPREDRLSQGHHRDSAKLYSRNDTFASLRVQRHICAQVAQRGAPNGRCPEGELPLCQSRPSRFRDMCPPQNSLPRHFCRAHGAFSHHAMRLCMQQQAQHSKSQAPIRQRWSRHSWSRGPTPKPKRRSSLPIQPPTRTAKQTKNNSCSRMTRACTHTFAVAPGVARMSRHPPPCKSTLALPKLGSLSVSKLKASCGARLGAASFVAVCKELCRRKACIAARTQGT